MAELHGSCCPEKSSTCRTPLSYTRLNFAVLQVDHYNRVAKGSSRRVVGILLGEVDVDGKVVLLETILLVLGWPI